MLCECGETAVLDVRRAEYYCPKCGIVIERKEPEHYLPRRRERELPKRNVTKGVIPEPRLKIKRKKMPKTIEIAESIARALQLPKNTSETAKHLAKKAVKNGMHGRRVAAACVLAACRMHGVLRTTKEFEREGDVTSKELLYSLKTLQKKLNLRVRRFDSEDYVRVFAARLNFYGPPLENDNKDGENCRRKNKRKTYICSSCGRLSQRRFLDEGRLLLFRRFLPLPCAGLPLL
uniref:Transcription factor TFIIB cyclin-like domain-containing protein n=1 Tax=Archaeoglobus fulgidus TaxID=2234 RepID=A0A7C2NM76_ARCFL